MKMPILLLAIYAYHILIFVIRTFKMKKLTISKHIQELNFVFHTLRVWLKYGFDLFQLR